MREITLNEIDIKEFGNNLQLGGLIFTGNGNSVIALLPGDSLENEVLVLSQTTEEYKTLIKQLDRQELKIFQKDGTKVLVRKSQRQLDQRISWIVFRRDQFMCRYCGTTDAPLTYDHVKLWEEQGENTVENGVSACKKCNKTRGNQDYSEWIMNNAYYARVSKNLPEWAIQANLGLLTKYKNFPDRVSKRSR